METRKKSYVPPSAHEKLLSMIYSIELGIVGDLEILEHHFFRQDYDAPIVSETKTSTESSPLQTTASMRKTYHEYMAFGYLTKHPL